MTAPSANPRARTWWTAVLVLLPLFAGCGLHTLSLQHDLKTERDSNGYVTYWKTKDGETRFEVSVSCPLADLHDELVVWLTPGPGVSPVNVGQIILTTPDHALTQYGLMQTSTKHAAFTVFVTNEESAAARSPHGSPRFWANVGQR